MTGAAENDADLVARFIELAWNHGDGAAAAELLGAGFRHHDLVTHAEAEALGYLGSILRLRSAFSAIEFQIREIFAVDGRVGSRWTVVGTHRSAGAQVEVHGLSIDHVVNRLIVENWTAWDMVGLQQQLPDLLASEGSD